MRTRRFTTVFLAAAMGVLSVAATARAADAKRVLMAIWNQETGYDKAFRERLTALGVTAEFTVVTGERDRNVMAGKLRDLRPDFEGHKFDLVYTWGTTVTQMAKVVVNGATPIVFNVVFDPVGAEIVKSLEEPGAPITGATNGVPFATQFASFAKLVPVTKLCLLFNAREPNANIIEGQARDWAEANAVTFTSLRVAPGNSSLDEYLADIRAGRSKCQVVYAGADSYLGNQAKHIAEMVGEQVILLGGTARFVEFGWLAALAPGVQEMGEAAAEVAAKILAGADASKTPVVLPTPSLVVSKTAAAKHGITIPAGAEVEQ